MMVFLVGSKEWFVHAVEMEHHIKMMDDEHFEMVEGMKKVEDMKNVELVVVVKEWMENCMNVMEH